MAIKVTDARKGMIIRLDGEYFQITKYTHVTPGKGQAINHIVCKNLRTGRQKELRMNTGDTLEQAYVEAKECQFLYKDTTGFVFMENESYEQFTLSEAVVADSINYIAEGDPCTVVFIENEAMNLQLPMAVTLEVVEAEEAVKGDTVSNLQKNAKVSTGYELKVPAHVKVGDNIKINTETGEYSARV